MDSQIKVKKAIPIIIFFVVFFILSAIYASVKYTSINQKKIQYQSIAANKSNEVVSSFDAIIARAFTIRTLIITDNGSTEHFMEIAESCYHDIQKYNKTNLKNIAIAPKGIVTEVYPLQGNESFVGFNFMDGSKLGNTDAISAYKKDELLITEPFELVQGGVGMGARIPIFISVDNNSEFWGLATLTMDFNEVLKIADLDSLSNIGIDYKLWYVDTNSNKVTLKASDENLIDPLTYSFSFQNLRWNISIAPTHGWFSFAEYTLALMIIFFISLMLAILTKDQIQIKKTNNQLTQLAYFDALTKCNSRQYVHSVLINQRTGKWNNPDSKYSIAIIDVDNFKQINDTYGHDFGDRTLASIANILLESANKERGDHVIRYGGDEFVILYQNISETHFKNKLRLLVENVQALSFPDQPDSSFSVSIGGDYYSNPADSVYYASLKRADDCLYRSKENGRNRYTI